MARLTLSRDIYGKGSLKEFGVREKEFNEKLPIIAEEVAGVARTGSNPCLMRLKS